MYYVLSLAWPLEVIKPLPLQPDSSRDPKPKPPPKTKSSFNSNPKLFRARIPLSNRDPNVEH